jgi:hypothetical protein
MADLEHEYLIEPSVLGHRPADRIARLARERDDLVFELRLWRSLVREGGVPRYTIDPGAGLNCVVEGTDNLLRRYP